MTKFQSQKKFGGKKAINQKKIQLGFSSKIEVPSLAQPRTATGMDGSLPHCIFLNLKPVEISKKCFNVI